MRDRYGLVPEHIRENIERQELIDAHQRGAKWLDSVLKAEDPHLSCVWVRDDIHPDVAAYYHLKPGRWHVRRRNPETADTYMTIENPDGSYREPTFTVLEELRRRDTTRPEVQRRLRERQYREQKAHEKAEALKQEQRLDEFKDNFRAARRVAGDSLDKRRWGRGKNKGVVGS